jgi:hypothetical protein
MATTLGEFFMGVSPRQNCSWSNSALRADRERGGFSAAALRI